MNEPLPDPPVNVRVLVGDGRDEIPVDCVFAEYDADGVAIWDVLTPRGLDVRGLAIDVLPRRTGLRARLL